MMLIGGFSIGKLLEIAARGGAGYLQGESEGRTAQAKVLQALMAEKREQQEAAAAAEESRRRFDLTRKDRAADRAAANARAEAGAARTRFNVTEDEITGSGFPDEASARAFYESRPRGTRATPRRTTTVRQGDRSLLIDSETGAVIKDYGAGDGASSNTGTGNPSSSASILRDILSTTDRKKMFAPSPHFGIGRQSMPGDIGEEGEAQLARLQVENQIKMQLRLDNPTATADELDQMYRELVGAGR